MAITVLPSTSFWSMLPQITQSGVGTYWQAQDRKTKKEEEERAKLMQQITLLGQQADLGSDVNDQMNELMAKIGLGGTKAAETPNQLKNRILNAKDLDISITADSLSISGERRIEEGGEGAMYHRRERRPGSFSRVITLPSRVDTGKVEAKSVDGVLTIVLPKAQEAKAKQITVKAG